MNKSYIVVAVVIILVLVGLASQSSHTQAANSSPQNNSSQLHYHTPAYVNSSQDQITSVLGGNWTMAGGKPYATSQVPNTTSLVPSKAAERVIIATFTNNKEPKPSNLSVIAFLYINSSYSNKFFNNTKTYSSGESGFLSGQLNNSRYIFINSTFPDLLVAVSGNYLISLEYSNNQNSTHLTQNQATQLLAYLMIYLPKS